jgi:Mrp family chromosome partitioning ATPase
MTRVFAGASGKGGAGKTTIVANLVSALTKLQKTRWLWMLTAAWETSIFSSAPSLDIEIYPPWVDSARHIHSESRQATESRRGIIPQCPSQPCLFARSHGDLCIAPDNLAKRPDSIVLAAAVLLKDESWTP